MTCKNCLHIAVCGKYQATGGHVRNCKNFETDIIFGCKWIPVTERLPENDVLVLCIGAKGGMFLGYPQWVYEDEKVAFTLVPNSRHSRQAKYWMPLPEPPKEEPRITDQTMDALKKMGEKAHGGNE